MNEIMLKIDNVSKQYKLGEIGGTTLRDELQRISAKLHRREDPTRWIGAKEYKKGESFLALDGVSFEVKSGERVGIIGHNGAGKSTLLKLISRVTAPTNGMIGLNGRVASMLEVGTGFHGELTGRENIYMNGAILGMTKKEIDSKMEDIIEFSECRQFIDTPVKRYSSGMYVKLAFSVAAHLDSEIMIMDEVLAVGDLAFQKKCLDKMSSVSETEGRTILYVSHNMNTIRQLCGRVIVLDHGKVVFDGDVEDGIGVYMKVNKNEAISCDYTRYIRPSWLSSPKIKLISAEYLDKDSIVFENTERVKIRFFWENLCNVENLCLRIEVRTLDEVCQATFVLHDFYSGKAGEKVTCDLALDISQFMNSSYRTIYTFFYMDSLGHNQNIECVSGLCFEVLPALNGTENELLWDHKRWGYVKMPEPIVLSWTAKMEE